ncbi:helix-turn-helix transcriptional regulator [Nitrospira defluvii]|nr:helix-turn-helix transcriptional regulator [Nitrospira defluvii]
MLAVVKKHHTKKTLFEVKGDIPSDVMGYLKEKFGQDIEIVKEEEELVNIFDTKWYKEVNSSTTPGETMKIYRENIGFSQTELGKKLGKFTRQKISDMENGKRNISKEVAKRLSLVFGIPVGRFI